MRGTTAPALALALLLALSSVLTAEDKFFDAKEWSKHTKDARQRGTLNGLIAIHEKVGTAFGVPTRLLICDSREINAFAGHLKKEKVVVFNAGLLDALDEDEDAIAAVMSHEIAHHARNHVKSGGKKRRVLGILGVAAGAVLDHATGGQAGSLAYDATGFASSLLSSKFNRDQERQADGDGITYMVQAGYNPAGAARMHEYLLAHGGGKGGFLSSHPGGRDRIENIGKLIAASPAAQQLASKQQVPLYVPDKGPGKAVANEPYLGAVGGVALERYAKMANEIAAAGGSAEAYVKLGTTQKAYESLAREWTARMLQDPALGKRFLVEYLAASTGRFAPYGRSAAKLMAGTEVDEEAPPMEFADFIAASKALQKTTPIGKALAPYKLSPYDWTIISSWWMQRLKDDEAKMLAFVQAVASKQ
jgi:Zn-dependent protease with chaperone function